MSMIITPYRFGVASASPARVAEATAMQSSNTTTITLPAHEVGDTLVACLMHINGSRSFESTPAGWTQIASNTSNLSSYVFKKVAASGESNPSWVWSGSAAWQRGTIIVVRGGSGVVTVGTFSVSDTNAIAPSINAPSSGILYALNHNNSFAFPTLTSGPSGMTQSYKAEGTGSALGALFYQEGVSAGATGDKTFTWSAYTGFAYHHSVLIHVG